MRFAVKPLWFGLSGELECQSKSKKLTERVWGQWDDNEEVHETTFKVWDARNKCIRSAYRL